MSSYNYTDYLQNQQAAANKATAKPSFPKVGFFKLKEDGDIALVRFNISSTDDLTFVTGHTISINGRWMRVSCLNSFDKFRSTECPLCAAVANGNTAISLANTKIYVQMLVAYKDKATGGLTPAEPVCWERPSGFARELANLIKDFGDLREHVFKVTRNGVAGDMKTTYSVGYVPLYDKPEYVPTDLSVFSNFNVARHSYWEKTADEINTYLETGSFPAIAPGDALNSAPEIAVPTQAAPAQPQYVTPTMPAQEPVVEPAHQTTTETYKPLPCFILYSKAKFACYFKYLLTP